MHSALVLSLAAVAQAASFKVGTIHDNAAPLLSSVNAETISGSYIVKFKDHVDTVAASKHHSWVQEAHSYGEQQRLELRKRSDSPVADAITSFSGLKHTYEIGRAFRGYSGHFHDSVIEKIRRHPDVESIEQDSVVHTMLPAEAQGGAEDDICDGSLQSGASWGLARLSHQKALGFGTFNKFNYAPEGGEGVDAYVVDTGCNIDHVDFEGRAHWDKTIPDGEEDVDSNGHGTHCSGTIAGKNFGVAKKAHVFAIKVLRSDGSGTMSDVIKGVERVVESHRRRASAAKAGKGRPFKGSVANMSLGGGSINLLNAAVNAAVDAGVHFAVAAGNDNDDACKYSPASASMPLTVGASTVGDSRAYFSNFGECVDIFAPGLRIKSAWIGSRNAVNTISGTSMASPHIAGLLAYLLSLQPAKDSEYAVATINPTDLKEFIMSIATKDALKDLKKNTPNLLAWNGGGCSNLTDIARRGGYVVKSAQHGAELSLGEAAKKKLEVVSDEFADGARSLGEKAEAFAAKAEEAINRAHGLVQEGMREFLAEIPSRLD